MNKNAGISVKNDVDDLLIRVKKLEEDRVKSTSTVDGITIKIDQINKSIKDMEPRFEKKIKQALDAKSQHTNCVSHDEINIVIAQIDEKLTQLNKLSENNIKSQIKALEESMNKKIRSLDTKGTPSSHSGKSVAKLKS